MARTLLSVKTDKIMSTKHHLLYMMLMNSGMKVPSESVLQWCWSCVFNHYLLVWKINYLGAEVGVWWMQPEGWNCTNLLIFRIQQWSSGWGWHAGMTRGAYPTPWQRFQISISSLHTPRTLQSSVTSTPPNSRLLPEPRTQDFSIQVITKRYEHLVRDSLIWTILNCLMHQ
jgi:hypothetical protein